MLIRNNKKYFFVLVLTLMHATGLFVLPESTRATPPPADDAHRGVTYGWYNFAVTDLGPTTVCTPNQAEFSTELKELDSMNQLADWSELEMRVFSYVGSDIVSDTGWQTTVVSDSVCVDPVHGWVRTEVRSRYPFETYHANRWGWRPRLTNDREQQRGRHIRIHAHPHPVIESPPVTRQIEPNNEIVNTTPVFRFRVERDPVLYGASQIEDVWHTMRNDVTNELILRQLYENLAGVGDYTLAPVDPDDGLYWWRTGFRANGPGRRPVANPFVGVLFRVDRTAPTASAVYDVDEPVVDATGSLVHSVTFSATAQDEGAGLDNVRLHITSIDDPSENVVATYNFDVGDGLVGGPTSEETIDFPVTLQAGGNYQYFVEATDAAGNTQTTAIQTVDLPDLPFISGTSCDDIGIGSNTCSGTISWGGGADVYNVTRDEIAYTVSDGSVQPITLTHGANTIQLRDTNDTVLAETTITASCDGDIAEWSSSQNACAPLPPTVSVMLLVDDEEQTTVPTVLPAQDVRVVWDTVPPASVCEWHDDYGGILPTVSGSTGTTDDIATELLELGEEVPFTIRCRRTEASVDSRWAQDSVSSIIAAPDIQISLDRTIVRAGDTTTATWSVANITDTGYVLDCRIALPGREPIIEVIDTDRIDEDAETGMVRNAFDATITCTEQISGSVLEDRRRIEVMSPVQER